MVEPPNVNLSVPVPTTLPSIVEPEWIVRVLVPPVNVMALACVTELPPVSPPVTLPEDGYRDVGIRADDAGAAGARTPARANDGRIAAIAAGYRSTDGHGIAAAAHVDADSAIARRPATPSLQIPRNICRRCRR